MFLLLTLCSWCCSNVVKVEANGGRNVGANGFKELESTNSNDMDNVDEDLE